MINNNQQSILQIIGKEACQIMNIYDKLRSISGSDHENNQVQAKHRQTDMWKVAKTVIQKKNPGNLVLQFESKILGYKKINNPRIIECQVKKIQEHFYRTDRSTITQGKSLYKTFKYKNILIYENQYLCQFFKTAMIEIKRTRKQNNESKNTVKNKGNLFPSATLTKLRRKSCQCSLCGNMTGMEFRNNFIYMDNPQVMPNRKYKNKNTLDEQESILGPSKKKTTNFKQITVNCGLITSQKINILTTIKKQKMLFKDLSVMNLLYKQSKGNIINSIIMKSVKIESSDVDRPGNLTERKPEPMEIEKPQNIIKFQSLSTSKKTLNKSNSSSSKQLPSLTSFKGISLLNLHRVTSDRELPSITQQRSIQSKQNVSPPKNPASYKYDSYMKKFNMYTDKNCSLQQTTPMKNITIQRSRTDRMIQRNLESICVLNNYYNHPRIQRDQAYGLFAHEQSSSSKKGIYSLRHIYTDNLID